MPPITVPKRPTARRAAPPRPGGAVGDRLAALARTECGTLATQLGEARAGNDRAVHQARKTLQRLRAIVRAWAPLDPLRAERENLALRRMRRRLGPLRDAGARRETLRRLATRPRWAEHAEALRALADREAARHRDSWLRQAVSGALWRAVERESASLAARLPHWPCAGVTDATLDLALAQARRRLRRRLRAALGRSGHEIRHELRRKLRHYANLRQVDDVARGRETAATAALLELAKRCGVEGDLWVARCSANDALRDPGAPPSLAALARGLQAERRARCTRHDDALARALDE